MHTSTSPQLKRRAFHIVAMVMVSVGALSGGVDLAAAISRSGGPKHWGLRAFPVSWPSSFSPVTHEPDPASVPIPCAPANYAPAVPGVGYDVGWFGVMKGGGDEGPPWSTIRPDCFFCLGQREVAFGPGGHLCAYRIGDEGWLVVDLIGNYYRVTPDLQRADPLPLLERLALRYGEVPWAATGALLLLVPGAALALRRRSGYVLRALGVVIAWLWLIPLATFMSRV